MRSAWLHLALTAILTLGITIWSRSAKAMAQDVDAIEPAMKELETAFHAASQEMYQAQQQAGTQAGPQPGAQPNAGNQGGDNVTDVDFEEVK